MTGPAWTTKEIKEYFAIVSSLRKLEVDINVAHAILRSLR